MSSALANRLAKEKSPYLLQHAHNPVDWYPWGEEAFKRAKEEDRPILLSIGYSTCHWCHVMEHESFENDAAAEIMNRNFISIKVDREERPDLDALYMAYVQSSTGSGGWPMTVFLTPDKKPFYGGTYFPPEDAYGRPGFKNLLNGIADAWKTRREEIVKSADSAAEFLRGRSDVGAHDHAHQLSEETLKNAFLDFGQRFDSEHGGFGSAPKFPMGHALGFLLRYWKRSGDEAALKMATKTLDAMAAGGLYDQLGGGFHRYSTDGQWRVPHFEKMLYDQAGLARAYLEAYQATHKENYARIARETLDYVLREMTISEGAFTCAQDADSTDPEEPSHKKEGAYFVWRKSEIKKILSADADLFCHAYGIEEEGNAVSDPHAEFKGRNVLTIADSAADLNSSLFKEARKKLLDVRSRRPVPHRDDKVITDWNGLMIGSFAFASRVLAEPRYRDAAVKAAEFIEKRMKDAQGALYHRYRDGDAAISPTLDDHAFLAAGFLDLYEATFDDKWLRRAKELTRSMIASFWDEKDRGFFMTAITATDLIARPKGDYDGAVPSGNSMAVLNLIRLSRFTGESAFEEKAAAALEASAAGLSHQPSAYAQLLIAFDFQLGPSFEITLSSEKEDAVFLAMIKEIYGHFLPNKIVLWKKAAGPASAMVCHNRTCALPVHDVVSLKKLLSQ